ncbi:MAG: type II secretion system F family protein [Burkholderiaceae bacterium]
MSALTILVPACAGLAVLLLLAAVRVAVVDTPEDDRTYKDRPPRFWALLWPLVLPLSRWPGSWMVQPSRARWLTMLRQADLDHSLTPEQFQAGRVLAGLVAPLLMVVVYSPRGLAPLGLLVCAGLVGLYLPLTWLRDRMATRTRRLLRELPFFLDIITLSLESGLNLSSAIDQAIDKGPAGPFRTELTRVMRDLRAGRARADALRGMAERLALPAVGNLVSALVAAEKQGASLGPVLRAQAEQRRNERFMRAEKLAMEAPVKMLFPLLLFIFPCTFLILFFPVFSRIVQEGWLN